MAHRRGVPTNHIFNNKGNDESLLNNKKRNLPALSNTSPRLNTSNDNDNDDNNNSSSNNKKTNIIQSRILTAIKNDNDEYENENIKKNNSNIENSNEIITLNSKNNNNNYGSGYILNSYNQKNHDETSIALQKILELEMKDRKASDEKCSLLIEQNTELTNEILILRSELLTLNDRFSKLSDFNDRLMCKSSIIDSMNMTEIEDLEKQLKISLDAVEVRKATIIREELGKQKEERLCVICQEKEKSVVLLPCRHMCLCDTCSIHEYLQQCPLCRRPIAHKISVYA
jgi:hypothetical protein